MAAAPRAEQALCPALISESLEKNTKEAHGFIIYGLFPAITNRKHLQGEGTTHLLSEMSVKPKRKGTKCGNYPGPLQSPAIIKYS